MSYGYRSFGFGAYGGRRRAIFEPTPNPPLDVAYTPASGYELGALQSASYSMELLGTISGLPLGYTVQLPVGFGLFYLDGLNLRLSGSVNYNTTTSYAVHIRILNASGVEVDGIDIPFNVIIGALSSPRWITETGSGDKTGIDYANAAPLVNLSSMILQSGANGIVNVVGADINFTDANIPVTAGAAVGTQTLIQATDASGNYVRGGVKFTGTRRLAGGALWTLPSDPEEITYLDGNTIGNTIFRLSGTLANRITFRGFEFRHVCYGLVLRPDTNKGLDGVRVEECDGFDTSRLVEHSQTSTSISNFTLKKSTSVGFSRAIFRCSQAASNILIEDVSGNSARQVGDAPGATQAFCEIFDITGAAINTVIRGTVTDRNDPGFMHIQNAHADYRTNSYMNGDGIVFNGTAIGVLVENVLITGCTDGGIDSKAKEAIYRNVWCEDNKRSFRIWIETTVGVAKPWFTLENCRSVNPTIKRNPPGANDNVPLHYGFFGFRPDALFKGLNTADHDPALPGCANAIGIRTEASEPILRFVTNSFRFNGQLMNSEADFAAYTGNGVAYSKLSSDVPIFYFGLDLSNLSKAVVPAEQRNISVVENTQFTTQFTADRPFTMRLRAASPYGSINRTGLFTANAFNLDYEVLHGQPASLSLEVISPERNVDTWSYLIDVTDDEISLDTLVLWVAPVARGSADGSTFANAAAARTAIPTFIDRIIAEDVPGEIRMDATSGDYVMTTGDFVIISKGPASEAKRIRIYGCAEDGTPTKAVIRGNRSDAQAIGYYQPTSPSISSQSNGFRFKNYDYAESVGFLTFDHFTFRHMGNGCFRFGRPSDSIIMEDIDYYNVYRFIECENDGGYAERPLAAPITNLINRRITGLRIERAHIRARYTSHDMLFEDIDVDADLREGDPFCAIFNFAPTNDATDDGECYNVTLRRVKARRALQSADPTYDNGDALDWDSGASPYEGRPRGFVMEDCEMVDCSDAGVDHKTVGAHFTRVKVKNCKWNWKDAGAGGDATPTVLDDCMSIEPGRVVPAVSGSLFNYRYMGYKQTVIFNNWVLRNRGICNICFDYTVNANGSVAQFNGWTKFNVKDDFIWRTREGSPNTTDAYLRIDWNPPLPSSDFSIVWKAGFAGGAIPQGTPVGTAVADITWPADGAATRSLRVISGSTAFVIDQAAKTLKLASALNYASAPYHELTIRGVYGIVGVNPDTGLAGDPADDLTWQCYLGTTYVDKMVVCAVTGAGENAGTTTFFSNNGLTAPSVAWRAAIDVFQCSLDQLGLRTGKADIYPIGYAWSGAVAVLDALGVTSHNGAIEGTVTYDPSRGMFQSPGVVATDRVVWAGYNPSLGGKLLTQNSGGANIEMATDLSSANNFLFAAGYELFTGRINGTQGRYSFMTASTRVFNLSSSAAAWWTIRRTSSTVMDAVRNFSGVDTRTQASQAIGSGITMCKTNPNKGMLRSIGGNITYGDSQLIKQAYDRLKVMANQLA